MAAVELSRELESSGVAPWVLLVEPDRRKRRLATAALEQAGYGVAVVAELAEAMACLAIMTPAMVIVGDLPGAGDLLDRARSVGIETARHGDVMSKELP